MRKGLALGEGYMQPQQSFAIALGHHQAGRLDEAEAAYRQILAVDPNHVDSLHLLGTIAIRRGRPELAIELIGKAIGLRAARPVAEFHNNIAAAFRALGQTEAALAHCRRAVALKPDYLDAHNNLGATLLELGRLDDALAAAEQARALKPDNPTTRYLLGNIFRQRKQPALAIENYRRALAARPDYAEAHNNLGVALKEQGLLDEAAAECERALALRPNYANAHYNLGLVLEEQGQLDRALAQYQRAQALQPSDPDAFWNESLLRLLRGDFATAWPNYERRLQLKSFKARRFAEPLWDGGYLTGRTILIHAEQGYGDTIQFIRYARIVKERGAARVIVDCPASLLRLVATAEGIDELVATGSPLPPFDCQAPLLSVPGLVGTEMDTIPAKVPYLHPNPELAESWRGRLAGKSGLSIGLVWRGNPENTINHRKSVPPELIRQLTAIPGINWISLQADATPEESAAIGGDAVLNWGPTLTDWADTAALVSVLDLVIAVDTAVAHLTGALGKPGWVMLSAIPDWRWLLDRPDSPWYPTLRLFRQPSPGRWDSVLSRVAEALESLATA